MSANKNTQNFGRQAPIEVAKSSTRAWLKRTGLASMIAAASLVATNDVKAQDVHPLHSPVAAERIAAEVEAIEAAFRYEVDIVNVDQDKYTDAGDTMFDPDGPEGEAGAVRIYYSPRIAELEADLLEAFNAAGTFDNREGEQPLDMAAYLPEDQFNAQADEVNQILARNMAQSSMASLVTAQPTGAYAVPMDFDNGEGGKMRVCLTRLVPSHTDEDTFMGSFLGGLSTRGIDHELADLQQYVANHEFAHCLTHENGMPTWVGETLADSYALTRHMQLNGEDGFADTVLSIRRVNAFRAGGGGHNTVPGLERLIPRLREAHAEGRLEGLNPREIRDLSFELLLGSTEQEVTQSADALAKEFNRQKFDYMFLQQAGEGRDGRLAIKDDVPPAVAERLQGTVDSVNVALTHLSRPNVVLNAAEVNSSEAEMDFRDNMDEYVATQASSQVALEGVQARLFSMDRLEEAYIAEHGAEGINELHEAFGADKISFARKREIYQGYEQQLEYQVAMEAEQEQDRAALAMR